MGVGGKENEVGMGKVAEVYLFICSRQKISKALLIPFLFSC